MTRLEQSKRAAAYHEAGHYVMARHSGVPVSAWIWRDYKSFEIGGKTRKFSTWLGNCQTTGRDDILTDHQKRLRLVAGAIAEIAWERRADDQHIPDCFEIEEYMSDSDRTLDGEEIHFGDLSEREWQKWWKAMVEAHAVLNRATGPLWPTVQRVARRLTAAKHVALNKREMLAAYKRLGDHCARELQRERKVQRKANSG